MPEDGITEESIEFMVALVESAEEIAKTLNISVSIAVRTQLEMMRSMQKFLTVGSLLSMKEISKTKQ